MDSYYQGEDIPIHVELFSDSEGTQKIDIDALTDLVVYMYSDGASIVKMSKVSKAGYLQLLKKTEYKYSCIVSGSLTKLLAPGVLFIEVNIVNASADTSDGRLNRIQKTPIGIIHKSLVKVE